MNRHLVVIALLLATLWQSVALARAGLVAESRGDLAHAALHWQDEGHHHHHDGSYQRDDSTASVQHLMCDHGTAAAMLMVAAEPGMPPMGSAPPGSRPAAALPDPTPDGLLRPPRARA